ncbi:MAG: hypothetical protein HY423_04765 [Candidatus Lambdaproteobacteria bacterium]|nr:hypothetical protein [Candidatus Lambdaproteobacteria bacterium]
MSQASFDTLTYARKLREAGFTERQAEAQAEALRSVVEENLATKRDIELVRRDVKELEVRLVQQIEPVRRDAKESETRLVREIEFVRRDMKELETRLLQQIELVRRDMALMRRDIIIWLGGLIVVAVTALGALMKLL